MSSITEAIEALRRSAEKTARLVEQAEDLGVRPDRSNWAIGDIARHLILGKGVYQQQLDPSAPAIDPAELSARSRQFEVVEAASGSALADELRAANASLIEVARRADPAHRMRWHNALPMDALEAVCVCIAEELFHGYDIARALGVRPELPDEDCRVAAQAIPIALALATDNSSALSLTCEIRLDDLQPIMWHVSGDEIRTRWGHVEAQCALEGDACSFLLGVYGRRPWSELIESHRVKIVGPDTQLAIELLNGLRKP
jgi:uncharacterized protein (TIGR03083 family)